MKFWKYTLTSLAFAGLLTGCAGDYLETDPTGSISEDKATSSLKGLNGMVEGLHNMTYIYHFAQVFGTGLASLNFNYDAIGDDFINTKPAYNMQFYRWTDHTSPTGNINYYSWDYYYTLILHANRIIEKSESLTGVDAKALNRAKGTALAYRAFAYHRLVQLFSKRFVSGAANDGLGVVLRLTEAEQFVPKERATVAETYAQINKDMAAALEALSNATAVTGKNSMSYAVANGIAARIALTQSDWVNAEKYAETAITSAKTELGVALQEGTDLINGFNDWSSAEWMWAYKQAPDQDLGYIHPFVTMSYNFAGHAQGIRFAINRTIYDQMGDSDVRRNLWICADKNLAALPADAYAGYFNPSNWEKTGQSVKYKAAGAKSSRGDLYMMRVAEMYYIQAEAEYRQSKTAEAQTTLNTIMKTRDANYDATAYTGETLWNEIYQNKRVDMWGEGERFFDMKRLQEIPNRLKNAANFNYLKDAELQMAITRNSGANVVNIPTTLDDPAWQFAIPYAEIKGNNLCKQNELKQ